MEDPVDGRTELLTLVRSLRDRIDLDRSATPRLGYLCGGLPDPKGPAVTVLLKPELFLPPRIEEGPPLDNPVGSVLAEIRERLGDCQRCGLAKLRRNIVFGEGNPRADLVFVGEAPGADEDVQGRPFVGAAGQLLTKIIEAMGLKREDTYICNILKCRPPGNRNPEPGEIVLCEPFLIAQIQAIQPRVICALGSTAARALLKTEAPISVLRGQFHTYQGIDLMPTYHPAYLLRNAGAKKQVWADVQLIMKQLQNKP